MHACTGSRSATISAVVSHGERDSSGAVSATHQESSIEYASSLQFRAMHGRTNQARETPETMIPSEDDWIWDALIVRHGDVLVCCIIGQRHAGWANSKAEAEAEALFV